MSESKFKNLQEDVCFKEPEQEISEPDKICPTCIPNESYIEPDWPQTTEPYLNEKKCEYQVKVNINIDGDLYHDGKPFRMADPRSRVFKGLSESPYSLNTLLKTYVRPAIRKMLRFYNKLETDEIVCASPPQSQGEICKGIFSIDYEQYVVRQEQVTDEQVPQTFEIIDINPIIKRALPQIENLNALELVARVQDYTFITNQKMLVVLVGVPAYRFDAVPDAPDLGSLDTSTDKIVIKPPEFMKAIDLFKAAMNSFKTFQSYFYREENGSLYFKETGDPFYLKFYAEDRINKFVDRLDGLLDKNGFDLRGFADTGTKSQNIAFEVEVSFDKTDEENPFTIKNVRARKKKCPYVECKAGLQSFIDKTKTDQTMLGYFSNINQISKTLQNNKTPPWLDFTIENTFPELAVNYGSSGNFEDDSCVKVNFDEMTDFILDEALDLFKAIEYKFNQNKCKTKEEMLAQRAEIQDFFSGTPDSLKQLKGFEDALRERLFQMDKIGEKTMQGFRAAKQIPSSVKNIQLPTPQDASSNAKKAASDFIKALNPCDFQGNLSTIIKCISAALTLDEVYYTIIKQIISSVGAEALEIVVGALPANKQAEIRKEIEKQFKDMPYPWDDGWEGGSLGKAVDRQTAKNIQENKDAAGTLGEGLSAEYQSLSLGGKIEQIEKRIAELKEPDFFRNYEEKILETVDSLNESKDQLRADLRLIQKEEERIVISIASDKERLEIAEQRQEFLINQAADLSSDEEVAIAIIEQEGRENAQVVGDLQRKINNQEEYLEFQIDADFDRVKIAIAELDADIAEQQSLFASSYIDLQATIQPEIDRLQLELEELQKKKYETDTTAQDINDYQNFSNMNEEQQQEAIDRQKDKTTIVATTPSDKIQQGTLGKALGNVQQALIQAYVDEIMKTATIGELQRAIENIPGADLLGKLVSRFVCASDPLVYPPIESFLSTLTFDPCSGEKTRFSLPTLQEIPTSFNWIEQLSDAFVVAIREVASRAIIAIMLKTTQLLNADYCQIAGNLTRNMIDDGGWDGFVENMLCPDPKSSDQKNKLNEQLLSAGGAAGRGNAAYQDLARVLSVSATQREIKKAMIGEADEFFLNNISTLVSNVLPQFSDMFSDRSSAAQYFQTMGNILTPEQRAAIQTETSDPLEDYPVELSICLTKEQKELWDQDRIGAFSDPELGREFVNKQDEKAKNDLADAANLLLNGPEGTLQNALNEAFNPKDPDCNVNKGVVPGFSDFPQNQQQTISNAITGIFKSLERAFIDDTVEANFFSSFFGAGPNTPGILSIILSNNKNNTINYHIAVKSNPVLNFFLGGGNMEIPGTVGIEMKNQIENYSFPYVSGKEYPIYFTNNKQGSKGFTNTIAINDSFGTTGMIQLKDRENNINFLTDNFLEIPEEYEPVVERISPDNPFPSEILDKMLQTIWTDFNTGNLQSNKIFQGLNGDIFDKISKSFVVRRDGQISEGFLYGNEDTPILEDSDLVYVGPNGEEPYEDFFTEEDRVLGRSKTKNPRVHFLDPEKYGGTYLKPQIYIAEADHKGWLQFSSIVVPNPTGCDPKNSNFLMLDSIVKAIDKNKQKIQNHELLEYSPECTVELPFDKVANSDTLATLEGIIRATIRVHLSDFLIRSFPIFSNIHLDIDRNFDNIMMNYISQKIYSDLKNETAVFTSTYEGYTYALLFLEQVVQIIHRKVRDGTIEENQEIQEILEVCNTAQESHISITNDDLFKIQSSGVVSVAEHLINKISSEDIEIYNDQVDEMVRVVQRGCAILSGKGEGFDLLSFFETATLNTPLITLDQARLASKIYTLDSVAVEMKKLLKYIIKEEMDIYTKKMREEIEPRPYIYDIRKFLIGGSHMLLGKQIEAGVYDNEVPIGGGVGNFPYGDINHCAKANMTHPLNNVEITDSRFEEIKKRGSLYLEKYVKIQPKEGSSLGSISGIQNISDFKQFLNQNQTTLDATLNISDYFGDATLSEDGSSYEGSIGIKYGVRLCYIPPEGYNPFDSLSSQNEGTLKASQHRSYILNPAIFQTESGEKSLDSSRYTFPICSYEQDILDVKVSEILDSNNNLDQDIKCYIDKLVETKNYKHLVDNVLQIKKIPSIYMIYSYNNFLAALGGESERDSGDDENPLSPSNFSKLFNDSKKEARKLFVAFYKNNDRDPPNEEDSNEDVVQALQRRLMDSLKFTNLNLGEFSFDIRRRLRKDNPFDKDGNECENNFGKLFNIGGS